MGRTAAAKDTFMTEAQKKSLEKLNMFPTTMEVVPRIHTGIYGLDIALGGGFPVRRVTEISGLNHSGKTTVALIAAASVIAEGGRVAYIDGEHALDKKWVLQYIPEDEIYWGEGFLENTSFHVYEPDYLEQGLEGMRELVNLYDLVIYDSIGGSPTRAFVEAAVGDQFYAPVARIMGIFKGVIAHDVKHGNAAVVFLNHVTTMIGNTINALLPYGGTYKPAGGEGMGFVSSIRLMMGNPEKLDTPKQLVDTLKKEVDDAKFVYGKKLKGQIFKNKLHAAPRSFDFNLINYPYTFFDEYEDIKDAAKQIGVLDQRGAYWYFEGEQVAPNNDAMKAYIASDEGIVIEDALKAKIRLLWAGEENADEPTKEFIRETTDPSL